MRIIVNIDFVDIKRSLKKQNNLFDLLISCNRGAMKKNMKLSGIGFRLVLGFLCSMVIMPSDCSQDFTRLFWDAVRDPKTTNFFKILQDPLMFSQVDIAMKDSDDTTLLMLACKRVKTELIVKLLSLKKPEGSLLVDVNACDGSGHTAFDYYEDFFDRPQFGSIDIVQKLLLLPLDLETVLTLKRGDGSWIVSPEKIKERLAFKNVLQKKLFEAATKDTFVDTLGILHDTSRLSCIDLDVRYRGDNSVFKLACQNGRRDVVEKLLLCKDLSLYQQDGRQALLLACKENHHEIVSMLLQFRMNGSWVIDIDAPEITKDPVVRNVLSQQFLQAVKKSQIESLRILDDVSRLSQIDLSLQDSEGNTALILASHNGYQDVVAKILSLKDRQDLLCVDIEAKNKARDTAFICAFRNKFSMIARRLLAAGADTSYYVSRLHKMPECSEKEQGILILDALKKDKDIRIGLEEEVAVAYGQFLRGDHRKIKELLTFYLCRGNIPNFLSAHQPDVAPEHVTRAMLDVLKPESISALSTFLPRDQNQNRLISE